MNLRLLGVPVEVRPSIVVVLALFGLVYGDPVLIALWVAIGLVSIVIHELGHALVARAGGAEPQIQLAGLGGVTTYEAGGRTDSRGWRLAISLSGPAVGLVVGGLAWVVSRGLTLDGYALASLRFLLFTSIGWSLFNLVPMLPLDGGQALRALLPGDPTTRTVRTAWVGVVAAVLLGIGAVQIGQYFVAIFAGVLGMQNFRTARAPAEAMREHEALRAMLAERDWRGLREALANGRGDRALARAALAGAAESGSHQLAAEIGEITIRRGGGDPEVVERTAAAWEQLGLDDRADRVRAGDTGEPPDDSPASD